MKNRLIRLEVGSTLHYIGPVILYEWDLILRTATMQDKRIYKLLGSFDLIDLDSIMVGSDNVVFS